MRHDSKKLRRTVSGLRKKIFGFKKKQENIPGTESSSSLDFRFSSSITQAMPRERSSAVSDVINSTPVDMNNNDQQSKITGNSFCQTREKRIKNALDWLRGILPENGNKSDLASVLELTVSYVDHFQSYMNKNNPDTLEEIRQIFKNKIPVNHPVSKKKINKRQHSEALDDCAKKVAKHRKLEHHQTPDNIRFRILAASTPNFQPKHERKKSYTKTLDTISEESRSLKRSKSESDIFGANDDTPDSSGIESFESPNKILHSTFSENTEKCWESPNPTVNEYLQKRRFSLPTPFGQSRSKFQSFRTMESLEN